MVKPGQPVSFRINGYAGQEFRGVVKRVDPAANEVTRQVEVLVGFAPGSAQPRVSGLYGEGRIEAETDVGADAAGRRAGQGRRQGLRLAPEGATPCRRSPVKLGPRDAAQRQL